jgi:predicted alpha/beta-fold hydrolase
MSDFSYSPLFEAPWWLNNPHLQTVWTELMRKKTDVDFTMEQFELECGDFIELAWHEPKYSSTVLMLPGLSNTCASPYVQGMAQALTKVGFNVVIMHFRGYSKKPNRFPHMYHGGQTCDLAEVINYLKLKNINQKVFAIGFSIGGNVLLKYLGEYANKSAIDGAIAISVPFLLDKTQQNLSQGFSRIYQYYLLAKLKYVVLKNIAHKKQNQPNPWSVLTAKDMRHFDELVTVPWHGFKNVADYYDKASSYNYLESIQTDTLIIHSMDDPFFPMEDVLKKDKFSSSVELVLTRTGGHVGFVYGESPNRPVYWLEEIAPAYFLHLLESKNS